LILNTIGAVIETDLYTGPTRHALYPQLALRIGVGLC
jgi:hypothetical protein